MRSIFRFMIIAVAAFHSQLVFGQTTAFKYQGSLSDSGSPASGEYQMRFRLFDAVAAGNQVGSTLTDIPMTALNGVFSVTLDFGSSALNGANRWIEIAVRRNSGEAYVTLSPREQIASSPYAVRTLSAQQADTALDSQKLGGVNANQFVQTNDARLTDSRNPLPGSTNYIQNQNAGPQASSAFNISGSGTAASFNVNGPLTFGNIAPPSVAPAGQSRFYFDTATNKLRVSENGGSYVNLVGAGGISGNGTANRIPFWSAGTTLGDSNIFQSGANIGINVAPQSRFHVNGTSWFQGDSTPLPAAAGKGIAVGFSGENGYIFGFDYGAFTPKNLILNGPGGNVGIGTLAPGSGLEVRGNGLGAQQRITDASTNNTLVLQGGSGANMKITGFNYGNGTPQPLYLSTDGANTYINANGGAVGIGMTAPTHALDVNGFFRAAHVAGGNVVSETSGGVNAWAKVWVRTAVQSWSIGTSRNFNNNQFYITDETNPRIRFSIDPNGGPIYHDGNMTQNPSSYGLPKAMALVRENGNGQPFIEKCYNAVINSVSPPCGIGVSQVGGLGITNVSFQFRVTDRFIAISPIYNSTLQSYAHVVGFDTGDLSGGTVRVVAAGFNGDHADFYIIVY